MIESTIPSPNPASVRPDHLLASLATKSLGKLRHIRNHVVDAEDGQRVRVGGNHQTRHLRTYTGAPRVGVREEEALTIRPAIQTFVVERLALLLEFGLERKQRQMDAAVIRRILTLSKQAVLFDPGAGIRNVLRVLIGDALAAFVVLLSVLGGPPIA